jgi:hypothetical protein
MAGGIPLTFKGHEVEDHHDEYHARYFNCGSVKKIYVSSINELLELRNQLRGQVSLDELADFAEANTKKLRL